MYKYVLLNHTHTKRKVEVTSAYRRRRLAHALLSLSLTVLVALWLGAQPVYADAPTFSAQKDFGSGLDESWTVVVGDIDDDGDLDIATGNYGQQNVVYLNDGTGNFEWLGSIRNFGTGTDRTYSVALGDMDGDGDLDLVTGNYNQQNAVYLNDGAGNFPFESARSFGDAQNLTLSVAVGDMDGDGHLDIVSGNENQENVVYLNDGLGNFDWFGNARAFGADDRVTLSVAVGDVNADGYLDIVTGNGGRVRQQNVIYLNNKDDPGHFPSDFGLDFGTGWDDTQSVAIGDMDGDDDFDIVVGNRGQQNVVYLNDENEFYRNISFGTGTDSTFAVAIGDMDGDGDLDIVTGNDGQQNVVYFNGGEGSFFSDSAANFGTGSDGTYSLAVGDVDGDGHLDIVTGNGRQQNVIYFNDGASQHPGDSHDNFGTGADSTRSVAVGDIDGDGDLDLVTGNDGQYNVVYLNDDTGEFFHGEVDCSQLPTRFRCFGSGTDSTWSVAVGDLDADGDLDLVSGNSGQNAVYLNEGRGHFNWPGSARSFGGEADHTLSVALGDVDSDGDLDIVTGNGNQQNAVYLNDGEGNFYSGEVDCSDAPDNVCCFGTGVDSTYSVAVGDVDGDGSLDIVTGNGGESAQRNVIYLNDGAGRFYAGAVDCTSPPANVRCAGVEVDPTRGVAVGDINGDGSLDIITGNHNQQNVVYLNDGAGHFDWLGSARNFGSGRDATHSVAVGDIDGDGDLDLITGNYGQQNAVFLNLGDGQFSADSARDFGPQGSSTRSVVAGDLDGDGDLDLVVGNSGQNGINVNRLIWADRLTNNPPGVAVARPGATPNAGPFSTPETLSDRFIPIPYALVDSDGDPVGAVVAYYSLDGGGLWYPAVAADGTPATNLATGLYPTAKLTNTHVFTWDTFSSGVFGQSDNVVFRLEAYPQPVHSSITDTYRYTNTVSGPFQRSYASATTFAFRVRGTQVRVMSESLSGTQRILTPVPNAMVYRLPSGHSTGGILLTDSAGQPFRTDQMGYLEGRGIIAIGDKLIAMVPITWTESYTLYHTSAAPIATGLDAYTVAQSGVQTLTVSADYPLILFNLDVSLEWDARTDEQFMSQLQFDLERTSEILYDWTNGQAALGDVTVYHDRGNWLDAHIRIYATNRMRPNAAQGGIVSDVFTDPLTSTLTYVPGQIHMGAIWNRYGEPDGSLSEDWPRALAHELGHFAFFLDDNYLGLDDRGLLIPIDTCPGAMSDPYRVDDTAGYDEFHHGDDWNDDCGDTLSAWSTGRWDWQTITTFYPEMNGVITNTGPSGLPLAVTLVRVVEPITPTTALEVPIFYLTQDGGRVQPGTTSRAFLFHEDQLTDLGRPTLDRVHARGARPGDRVCVYELASERLGCETVMPGYDQLALNTVSDWKPDVIVSPITSQTIAITVTNVPTGLSLKARLFSMDGAAPDPISLQPMTETLTVPEYGGTFNLEVPATEGYVHIWVDEPEPRREVVTEYALGGNPGHRLGRLGRQRTNWGHRLGRLAPAVSADGQVILFGKDLHFEDGEFYALQAATTLPHAPPWATVVGQAFRLSTSASAPDLDGTSITFNYLGNEVPPGEESWLRVYYWDGTSWLPLPTQRDTYYNIASAPTQGEGLYALMSSLEIPLHGPGWDTFGYPVQETRPITEALLSISGYYTTVYSYDATDALDPWKVYDVTVPDWVNDLRALEFGHSYWILISQPITLYLKGSSAWSLQQAFYLERNAEQGISFAIAGPPATYYGQMEASSGFTPTVGMTITAMVGSNMCGQSQTFEIDGDVMYAINVLADEVGHSDGCGAPGRKVNFMLEPYILSPSARWDNYRVQEWPLHLVSVYLPIVVPVPPAP